MRGRQLIDEALAGRRLAVSPRLEADSVASLLAQVGTGRWATIVPRTWLHAVRPAADTAVLRLADPSVTATVAVVTNAGAPVSVFTRALLVAARMTAVEESDS